MVRRQNASLSAPDTFVPLAESGKWNLLIGDGGFRELALAERIEMHGALWLFDHLADGNRVTPVDCTMG